MYDRLLAAVCELCVDGMIFYLRAVAYFCLRYFLKLGFLDGLAGFRWNFSALAYARRVRFPTGREPSRGGYGKDCGIGG